MSLYGSILTALSGLQGQSAAIAMNSDNIANINTNGYKATEARFATLVTNTGSTASGYSSGGVTVKPFQKIDSQGLFKTTGVTTDLSISGNGFFPVNSKADLSGDYLYTRAGSFQKDSRGRLVNSAGYYALAWPVDNEGRLPGEAGNENTISNALLDSLEPINIGTVSGNASQTTKVDLGINLKSSEEIMKGTGVKLEFAQNTLNNKISSKDVIVPSSVSGLELASGDKITLAPTDIGQSYEFTYGGFAEGKDISSTPIFSVSGINDIFDTTENDRFSISTKINGVTVNHNFKFVKASPTTANGEFNSLNTLSEAIKRSTGLSSRVAENKLYIANENANNGVTVTNLDSTNFVEALFTNGSGNITIANSGSSAAVATLADALVAEERFATLADLSNKISSKVGLESKIENPLSSSTLDFHVRDPLGQLEISAQRAGTDTASILKHFGLDDVKYDDGREILSPTYNAGDITRNFAGSNIQAQFSRNVRAFDAFGTGHDFQVNFGKIDDNKWAVEIFALNPSEIDSITAGGQVASGTIEFNGDGSLRSVSQSLAAPVEIVWSNKAENSNITFNWGSAGESGSGKTDGLRQLDSDYAANFIDQNGISVGLLNGIEIDVSGFVIAKFSNGTSRKIYRIPVADVTSPNNLESRDGNAYAETSRSGNFNLKTSNTGGVGKIQAGTLEQSNVDLSDELTRMIVAQRGYQANTKVIKTTNELLEELNRIF